MLPILRSKSYRPVFMSDFFNDDIDSFFTGRRNCSPAVNIREDEKKWSIEMALPGMSKEEVKIETQNDTILITSEQKEEKEENRNGYTRREFGHFSFSKSFILPENVDREKIMAEFRNGILTVDLPKSKEETKLSRSIKIN